MSTKISQLTSAVDVTANDLIQIVDVEDEVMAPSGTNKKTTASLLANQLVSLINAGAIAGSKIADSGITSAKIANDTIVNADINSSAAIAGTKISPDFGSQNIITTGTLSANVGSVISGSSASDGLRITQTGSGNAIVVEDFTNPDSSPFVVNQHGSLQIGFNQFLNITGYNGFEGLQLSNSGALTASAAITMSRWSADSGGPVMTIGKSRGVGVGNREAIQNEDQIGAINFAGDDGGTGDFPVGARILAAVDGTIGVGDLPSRLQFFTTPDGSASPVEAMRITSGQGIEIARTSVTAPVVADGNVFSGTYTPTLTNVTNIDTTAAFVCQYMRVGNVVTVSGSFNANPTATGDTEFQMSLPITSNFSSQSNLGGVAQSTDSDNDNSVSIYGSVANDRAIFRWSTNRTLIAGYSFTFTYRVI